MSLSALTPGNVFVRCSISSRSGASAMGVTIEKGRSGCRFSGSRVRLLAGLGVFFEDGPNVDPLPLLAFDILFGDRGVGVRDPIGPEHDDFAKEVGVLHGFDDAQRHGVVVAIEADEIRVLLENCRRRIVGELSVPVARNACHDLELVSAARDRRLEAVGALSRCIDAACPSITATLPPCGWFARNHLPTRTPLSRWTFPT